MKLAISNMAAAGLALALVVSASPATSADTKTWYVYCEGNRQGDHWAVFSENFWPHPLTEDYGRRVGTAAKAFFESRHALPLEGCAAVNFVDFSLAEHSRSRTAQLHKKMGDRVYYFPLPNDALPVEAPAAPARIALPDAGTAVPIAHADQPDEARPVITPRRAER